MLIKYKVFNYADYILLSQFSKYSYLELLIKNKNVIHLIDVLDYTTLIPLSYAIKIKIFMLCIEFSNNLIESNLSKKNKKLLKKIALINKNILIQCCYHFDIQARVPIVAYCRRLSNIGINSVSKHYPVAWLRKYYNFMNTNT
jgi:hypothetical protein